ncbi:hypothetical protein [Roseateles amylovorans]|uniref:Uncharacterized protein n=1 Tax=Roseateles amylovorans TaxID=2978473 RepID=A0ABY6AZY7_9BURK|nr:hypothetical protein [Roseateles amylovorans]UXH78731.1 hypothetical protein N4261_01965 [Roseateles amylovorans]
MTTHYYVRAKPSADDLFADCAYYYDKAGTERVDESVLRVPANATDCVIEQTSNTTLILIGATAKTLGQVPAMNPSNFSAADDQNAVTISMPNNAIVTRGVVLLFSNDGNVTNLYPSSDPQITNQSP